MPNVILKYQRKGIQKVGGMYSVDFMIDGRKTIRIAPETSAVMELDYGVHTFRAAIPFRGNESGVVLSQIDIKPCMTYEIIYTLTGFWGAGVMEIREKPEGSPPSSEGVKTIQKGPKNYMTGILTIFLWVIAVFIICTIIPWFWR